MRRIRHPDPSGGAAVKHKRNNGCGCNNDNSFRNKKKTLRDSGEGFRHNAAVAVDSENLVRRYPKHSPEEKMKGIATSAGSLEYISPTEKPKIRLVRGEECGASYDVCAICGDAKPHGAMWRGGARCRHSYCEACIKGYVGGKVKENIHKIKCPESDCKRNLDLKFCRELLAEFKEVVETWVDAKREAKVLGNPRWIKCPFKECSKRFVDDGKGFLTTACPKWWRVFCMGCKVEWHMGMTCGQYNKMSREIIDLLEDDEIVSWISLL
ncbi:probable E3 ubiquitin-protein ligase ARI10 [Ipomoea triloba]|uniref:probable E3 ubiquitin-protein ligase ARI10 n=1 Tax=Ipomoea triloba TaxID=35885 RepID=UPI00125DB5DA|nr:probable E3 ubiquitin-protein ligase ARI10 [Ipomoea triloba]